MNDTSQANELTANSPHQNPEESFRTSRALCTNQDIRNNSLSRNLIQIHPQNLDNEALNISQLSKLEDNSMMRETSMVKKGQRKSKSKRGKNKKENEFCIQANIKCFQFEDVKRLVFCQKLVFMVIFFIMCLEAMVRSLVCQLKVPGSNIYITFSTIIQQVFAILFFAFLQYLSPKHESSSKTAVYIFFAETLVVLLQQPIHSNLILSYGRQVPSSLLFIIFTMIYCPPKAELSLLNMIMLVMSNYLRSQLDVEQVITREQFDNTQQDNQMTLYLPYYDNLTFSLFQLVLCFLVFTQVKKISIIENIASKQQKKGKINQTFEMSEDKSIFENTNVGTSFYAKEDRVHNLKHLLEALNGAAAIIEDDLVCLDEKSVFASEYPFALVNTHFKEFVKVLKVKLNELLDSTMFQIIDLTTVLQNSAHIVQKECFCDCNLQDMMSEPFNLHSLRALIQQIQNGAGQEKSQGRIFIKLFPPYDERHSISLWQASKSLIIPQGMNETFSLENKVKAEQKLLRGAQKEQIDTTTLPTQLIFELTVIPMIYENRKCLLIQFTSLDYSLNQSLLSIQQSVKCLSPQLRQQSQNTIDCLISPIETMVKYSKILEQQLSMQCGQHTRTSILADQEEELRQYNSQITTAGLARIQYFLAFIWSSAQQLRYKIKSQISYDQNEAFLTFKQISLSSQSIEVYIKQILLVFSPQIEQKNLHVNVTQDIMPEEAVYTDWNIYEQIFYQIIEKITQLNQNEGNISIKIHFQKESFDPSQLQTSNSSIQNVTQQITELIEFGHIVTVIETSGHWQSEQNISDCSSLLSINEKVKGNIKFERVESLAQKIGGTLLITSIPDQGTIVTFEVQVTTYPFVNFKPNFVTNGGVRRLITPFTVSPAFDIFMYGVIKDEESGKYHNISGDDLFAFDTEQLLEQVFQKFDELKNDQRINHLPHQINPSQELYVKSHQNAPVYMFSQSQDLAKQSFMQRKSISLNEMIEPGCALVDEKKRQVNSCEVMINSNQGKMQFQSSQEKHVYSCLAQALQSNQKKQLLEYNVEQKMSFSQSIRKKQSVEKKYGIENTYREVQEMDELSNNSQNLIQHRDFQTPHSQQISSGNQSNFVKNGQDSQKRIEPQRDCFSFMHQSHQESPVENRQNHLMEKKLSHQVQQINDENNDVLIDQVEQSRLNGLFNLSGQDSDHQFSDLSVNSEIFQASNESKKGEASRMEEIIERINLKPLHEFKQEMNAVLMQKGSGAFLQSELIENFESSQVSINSIEALSKKKKFYMSNELNDDEDNGRSENMKVSDNSKKMDQRMMQMFIGLPSMQLNAIKSREQIIQQKNKQNENQRKVCKCRNILVIDDDQDAINVIQEAAERLNHSGVESASTATIAIKLLSQKLQAQCCKDSYDFLFVLLSDKGLNTIDEINETIDLWNQKLRISGKSQVQSPMIIGLIEEESDDFESIFHNSISSSLKKPIRIKDVKKLIASQQDDY